ncbi:MAG TPA: hypothetical protein GYA08_13940 [Chloroflexi bacterium]|nr:hypothetical protein [Chloroflexota bacterium]
MLHRIFKQESGQSLIEYTLLLGLLALAVFGGVALLGERIGARLANVDQALTNIVQSDASTPEQPALDDSGNANEPGDDNQDDNQDHDNPQGNEDAQGDEGRPDKPGKPHRPLPPERPAKPDKPWFPWLTQLW